LSSRIKLLILLLALGAAGAAGAAVPSFSGDRALWWVERQCALGPRVPGSEAHAALERIVAQLCDSLGLRLTVLPAEAEDPLRGGTVSLRNLVISAGGDDGDPVWLGAHYDSRPICDRESDPGRAARPLPGANDGASGVAVLLHLAELMAASPPPRPVRLLLLDGEDLGRAHEPETFCLGSRDLAARWDAFGSPLAGRPPVAVVILDMVGRRGLQIRREGISQRYQPRLMDLLFSRAAQLGLAVFLDEPGRPMYDDHVPLLRAGLPAVDLIDPDDPHWHTLADVPGNCSAGSLEQVGRLVTDLVYDPAAP